MIETTNSLKKEIAKLILNLVELAGLTALLIFSIKSFF